MPKLSRPRHGSLQFYPRKRVDKRLPSVNWEQVQKSNKNEGFLGFIGYKVGMTTAIIKDNTDKSMMQGKKVALPVTILEVPNMKIYSVRFYKNGKVMKDIVVSNDKELKKKVKLPKEVKKDLNVEGFDDVRVIAFSNAKSTGIKKTPDMIELAVQGANKLETIKSFIGKEITMQDFLKFSLADVRGLTKGKGLQGTVKRFGITLKGHKSEKGVRKPGSLAPWHPARVTFRTPMAGQLGMFTRVHYNLPIISSGNIKENDINRKGGFRHYGNIQTNYVILAGSVQGPQKRQILVTPALRPNKKQSKKKYELVELK